MATYTVKAGDSLSKIARDVLGDMARWPEIAKLNAIAAPYVIRVGQLLELPANDRSPAAPAASSSPAAWPAPAPVTFARLIPWIGLALGAWWLLSRR